jgi:hypothetical protein
VTLDDELSIGCERGTRSEVLLDKHPASPSFLRLRPMNNLSPGDVPHGDCHSKERCADGFLYQRIRGTSIMLMADTLAIFFVILGLLLAFPGYGSYAEGSGPTWLAAPRIGAETGS